MRSVIVLHRSKHGHTAKIAERIAARLRAAGIDAVDQSLEIADVLAIDTYDAIVLGSSVHAGHHDKNTLAWIRRHDQQLRAVPSAAFSVSLSAAEDTEEARGHVAEYLAALTTEAGWQPDEAVSFAGALQYLEYDRFTRLMIRLMMKRAGHPTDTSHDYDYTDWDAVDAFADAIAAKVSAPAETAAS